MSRWGTCVCFLAAAALLCGQGTDLATIRGAVTDASGAVIASAKVTVTDLATGDSRQMQSNARGEYEINGLKYGNYRVTVSAPGFDTRAISGVQLRTSETARVDARLEVTKSAETVTVQSEAPAVQTDSPTLGGSLTNRDLIELPRDSRDIYSFLYVNPNVTQSADGSGFKFLGAQSYGASFSLDGQRSNGGIFGEPTSSQPSLETVGELTILTNNFTAEYAGIANVRVTTKRGESAYHGSLFYNNRNSALAAWTLSDKFGLANFTPSPAQQNYPNPFFNLNEFGGSVGGPVPKIKHTYFMAAYEKRFTAQPVQVQGTTLPHPSLWIGDFTKLNDSAKPLVPAGVTLSPAEVANFTVGGQGLRFTRLPDRLINPVTQKLIQTYFPAASVNAPINPSSGRLLDYFNLLPQHGQRDLGTMRVDHDFSSNDRFYTVFNVQNTNQDGSQVVPVYTGFGLLKTDLADYTLSNSYTRIISPTLVNEVRGGFNREDLFRRGNTTLRSFLQSAGFNDADIAAYGSVVSPQELDTIGHTAITLGTFRAISNGGRSIYRPLDQHLFTLGDTLTWVKGKHVLKFGADAVRNSAVDGFTANRGNARGQLAYTGNGIDAFTRFLMGLAPNTVSYVSALRPPMDVYNWENGFFVQDEWRIRPRLTLNLGLRYELITPFIEANNLFVNFDPNYKGPNGQLGRFVIPSKDVLSQIDARMVNFGVVSADQLGVGRGLVNTDRNNFAPRIGLAWRLTSRSVLRGGIGVFYPTSAAQGVRDALASAPFNQGVTKTNTAAAPLEGWPTANQHGIAPLVGGQIRTAGSQPSINIIPFDLQQPRIEQYNATYEHEVFGRTTLRVSYLGTYMHGLIAGIDRNMLAPNTTPFGTLNESGTPCSPDDGDCTLSPADQARLPYPGLGDFMAQYGNFGHGRSNALQIQASRRYSHAFTFDATYTLLDQKTTALDSGNASLGGPGYNQFQPEFDFSRDAFVSKHRFVFNGIYDTPFGTGRKYSLPRVLDYAVGGWQLSFLGFIKSGTGFTPYWTCDNCGPVYPGNIGSGFIDAVGNFGGVSFRPTVTGSPDLRQGDQWWNAAAFGAPSVGADLFSNPNAAKRNALLGPGTWGVNLGVQKIFKFGERVRANLGADANNIFNHPLLSPGDTGFANLGSFSVDVDPKTGGVLPITRLNPDPNFGRLIQSFDQDGISGRRLIRLRLRVTF
jgi:hypothetical protein